MTLHDWLTVALRNLASAAQERMTAEYRAHVQDAMTDGLTEPEAIATLGDPTQVNRALRRAYATDQELSNAQGLKVWWFMLLLVAGYGLSALWFEQAVEAVAAATALVLACLAWVIVRSEPRPVRNLLLATAGPWVFNFTLWLGWSVQAWLGDPPSLGAILWLLPVLWVVWLVGTMQQARRMRRTLALEDRA
ncbi:hypothetical protein IHN63_05275 [Deinococcus sp. 6YEL10]|uniref:HAAS signaling domain-containing protein n=1 Tax=Deinococcus sp. 6YEL10 TaxID=2745870 RepID=UPI001E3B37BE|nr:hypothetical protein [Deinococcus sp. 6YEL10]MCD0160716.1 hypothetical protein [Deinococcus sp. 6YEL10]